MGMTKAGMDRGMDARFGFGGKGRPLQCRPLHVLEFTANGEITRGNVRMDLAAIIRRLPQA